MFTLNKWDLYFLTYQPIMKQQLTQYLQELTNLNEISLTKPPQAQMWDFAFWVFPLAKQLKKNPVEIASELTEQINQNKPNFIEKVEQVWPYINFFLSNAINRS